MPQALIKVNAVAGSNDDIAINTITQLDNQNSSGELTYTWTILDQPEGTADALSSTTIQNPTITPKKEGTYVIQLVVNQSLSSEVRDIQFIAVRFLKTRERAPGASETSQADVAKGWSKATNRQWKLLTDLRSDPGIIVAKTGAPALVPGNVLKVSGTDFIKPGLPGQETVGTLTKSLATLATNLDEYLYVLVSGVDGSLSPSSGALVYARWMGLFFNLAGAPVVGDSVYVSDTGTISTAPGTVSRRIGHVVRSSAGTYDIWVEGMGIGT